MEKQENQEGQTLQDTTLVYLDADFVCHTEPAEGRIPFETSFFRGREELVESYRIVPEGMSWTHADGSVFHGEMISPHAHNDTSPDFLRVKELEAALAEIQEALNG